MVGRAGDRTRSHHPTLVSRPCARGSGGVDRRWYPRGCPGADRDLPSRIEVLTHRTPCPGRMDLHEGLQARCEGREAPLVVPTPTPLGLGLTRGVGPHGGLPPRRTRGPVPPSTGAGYPHRLRMGRPRQVGGHLRSERPTVLPCAVARPRPALSVDAQNPLSIYVPGIEIICIFISGVG